MEFFGPVLLVGGGLFGVNLFFNEVPFLPALGDAVVFRRTAAYLTQRYGLVLTKAQVLKLERGKRVAYESARGEETLALLRPKTPLHTRELVRFVSSVTGSKHNQVVTQRQVPYPEQATWRSGDNQQPAVEAKRPESKKSKAKQSPRGKALDLTQQVEQLEREVAANSDTLPSFFAPLAGEIFATLKEVLPDIESPLYSTEQRYTLEATISEYLPTLIDNAAKLPKTFFRTSSAAAATSAAIERQLTLIQKAVRAINDVKYESAMRSIEQQGYFLDEKFDQHASKTLEIQAD